MPEYVQPSFSAECCRSGEETSNWAHDLVGTIRDMKKEQEAYNAKMSAKIHEQLNGWLSLRENMSTFSLQLKSLGTHPTAHRSSCP
jgi:hypothetical protein